MKIDRIRIVGVNSVLLPLRGASVNPTTRYLTVAVDGLGPPEFMVMKDDLPVGDAVLQGYRAATRQIVMRISLNPMHSQGETAETLRSEFYKLCTPGRNGYLEFYLDNEGKELCYIRGLISKIEPVLFSKDPEIQVTFECSMSYFTTRFPTSLSMPTPRENTIVIENVGDAPAGFTIALNFLSAMSSVSLYRSQGGWTYEIFQLRKPSGQFAEGDGVTIITTPGSRAIQYRPGGLGNVNGLPFLVASSDWPMLGPGENTIRTSNSNVLISTFSYYPKFQGV